MAHTRWPRPRAPRVDLARVDLARVDLARVDLARVGGIGQDAVHAARTPERFAPGRRNALRREIVGESRQTSCRLQRAGEDLTDDGRLSGLDPERLPDRVAGRAPVEPQSSPSR